MTYYLQKDSGVHIKWTLY